MSFELPSGDTIFTALAGAISGGGITKLIDVFGGKKNRDVKALGDTITIMAAQQERFDNRLHAAETGLDNCHALHDACEAGRQEDRREIEDLKAKIAQMMSGRASTVYHLNAPKGDPGKGGGK